MVRLVPWDDQQLRTSDKLSYRLGHRRGPVKRPRPDPRPCEAVSKPRSRVARGGATRPPVLPPTPAGRAVLDYATRNVARYCPGVRFSHKGLRRFYERGDARGLDAAHMARVRRLLTALQDANSPQDMALPGCRLHQLTGDRRGQWSVRVSGNWRIVFRFVGGVAVDVDLIDYH